MRYLDNLAIRITDAAKVVGTAKRLHLQVANTDDEVWVVPAVFTAECDDDRLPYAVGITVEVNVKDQLCEITRLDVTARDDGEAVHASGLRDLPLAAILHESIQAAAVYLTTDKHFGNVQTWPRKRIKPIAVARATDRRTITAQRKNRPPLTEAEAIRRTSDDYRRRGLPDYIKRTCDAHGISRATYYRRLGEAVPAKPKPKTKKRGKR